ncbi:MAG TPA: hypothetical protein VIW23_07870 [Candidatus Acidoferrum sp.]
MLGTSLQFSATVTGAGKASVIWSVNGANGGSIATGTISATGMYTAPADLPAPTTVRVTATSSADPSTNGTAQVTVVSDIAVGVSPATTSLELGAKQSFAATLTSSGRPDTSIRWTLSGGACPSHCGTVDANGNFTAPQILPSPATVTIVAQSAADPTKQARVSVTITSHFTLQLTAPGTVVTSATAAIVATLTPASGSNPSTTIHWSLAGTGCAGSACGTLSSVTTQNSGTGDSASADSESANYTAPGNAPTPNSVTITAVPAADPAKQAQATILVQPSVGVSLTPVTTTRTISHRVTLAVQLNGTSNPAVSWTVAGVAGGSPALGQICVVSSNPCTRVTSSTASQVDYLAPASLPSPNPLTVLATSVADTTKNASSQITVVNHDLVSILPGNVTLAPGGIQVFSASVLGTTNQNIVWQLQGAGCGVSGACGTITSRGTYTAPPAPPTPNSLQVVAISSDDVTQSGAATITISAGANIQSLHPASVYAGGANGFTLRVDGGSFALSSPGPGSTLLIGETARTTNCTSAAACSAPVFASDVATAGSLIVQLQNPDGTRSNSVTLVVAAPNVSDGSIALTNDAPLANSMDIVVVEPTTAGISFPGDDLDLNIAALGVFSVGTNTCSLAGNPVVLPRPASGAATTDICLFSQAGLDSSMAYSVTGDGDVSVVAKQPAGLGIIHLTLQVQSSAQPGARTLFIQNANLDKTAASGMLEVQ